MHACTCDCRYISLPRVVKLFKKCFVSRAHLCQVDAAGFGGEDQLVVLAGRVLGPRTATVGLVLAGGRGRTVEASLGAAFGTRQILEII
jgi:hypothetical protein